MKSIKLFLMCASVLSFVACGPSQEEIDKEKKKEDSIMEIERNKAIENADKLLQADTNTSIKDTSSKTK